MGLSRFSRTSLGTLVLVLAGASGCTGSPTPRTVVDHVATADSPSGTDPAGTSGDKAKGDVEDVEPVAVPIADSGLVEAKATVRVSAPVDKVRATVLKFEDYPHFMPEYSDAKRLGSLPDGNEKVYMEITTLGGVAKMWANIEVLHSKADANEVHEAKFIEGNVKEFKAVWTLAKVDDGHTDVTLQVFLHPAIPLPDFIVNKANLDGAKKGALAMKRRIENAQ